MQIELGCINFIDISRLIRLFFTIFSLILMNEPIILIVTVS